MLGNMRKLQKTRYLNDINRVVLPKEMVRALGWSKGTQLLLEQQENGIVISAASPHCWLCGKHTRELISAGNGQICAGCARQASSQESFRGGGSK